MRRIPFAAMWLLCVSAFVLISGCGPGLIALGGGGSGAWFGLAGGDDDKKSSPPPVVGPNVAPAVIVTALVREESPARVNYTLIDANSDTCSVEVEFSVGGGPFASCLQGAGGDPLTGLTSSSGGSNHEFRWDFLTDLGPQRTTGLDIRIRANDGTQFGSWFTLAGLSIGNDGPEISGVTLLGNSGVLLITFDLADQNSDLASFDLEWSDDSGLNFNAVDIGGEIVGNPPVGLLTSPAGSAGQIVWNSSVALNNFVGDILLRFSVSDQPTGYTTPTPSTPVVAGPFPLDNAVNQPPVLEIAGSYAGQQFVSQVPLDFTLADGESDAGAVIVAYSVNGGAAQTATLTQQFGAGTAGPFPTTPSPTFYSVTWDALADLQNEPNIYTTGVLINVILVPVDAQAGTPVITAQFTVIGNTAPEVTEIDVLNVFANVPVVVRLQDSSSDPVSIQVEYSTDGTNFTALAQSDFPVGSLGALVSSPFGEDNVLVWDTTQTFNGATANQPTVYLRIVPTDHPVSGTPTADLAGNAFTSAAFPIINNPAGATPVSVDFYSVATAGGTTATVPQHTTVVPGGASPTNERYFNRTINPASAVGYDTFYAVFEGPGYGTLLDHLGSPLNYPTATLTMAGPGAINSGDTVTIGDGFNTPIVFEFYNGGVQVFPNPNTIVDITSAANADDVALLFHNELVASFGSTFLLQTTFASNTVTLTHYIACNSGNAVSHGGSAPDLAFSNAAVVTGFTELQGGAAPTNGVIYVAPATAPGSTNFVTLKCEIDDPAFFSVKAFRPLFWGAEPTSATITPGSPQVLIRATQQFNASVLPVTAPQIVDWEVVGGTQNGTITSSGLYTAPSTMPGSSLVTIRAYTVKPGVFGTAQLTLLPEPSSVDVTSAGGVSTLTLSGGTSSTLQFSAQVQPLAAPQGVNWRIFHNGFDQGTGNPGVGTVSPTGLYTAPNNLISPPVVQIQAVSQVNSSIYGSFNLTLVAPAPTSFQISPSSAIVFAGGAGQQFNAVNFVPTNANPAVSWEVIPSIGFGTVDNFGFYTPPASVAAQTNVTVRARSSVAGTVFADAIVDLRMNVATTPASVLVSPDEGITMCVGPQITFTAVVSPGTASQSVVWTIVGTPIGTIDATGKYTPAIRTTDYVETIRATATGFPAVFDEAIIRVTGNGHTVTDRPDLVVGRSDASALWDATNQRLWWIGGASEVTTPDHDISTLFYDVGSDNFQAGPTISGAGGPFAANPRSVTAVVDTNLNRIWAICGLGASNPRIFFLPLSTPTAWTEMMGPGGTALDIPQLVNANKYPMWYDTTVSRIYLMQANNEVFRYEPSTNNWLSRVTISQTSQGPAVPLNNAFVWRQTSREGVFIGPESASGSAANRVSVLEMNNTRWVLKTSLGQPPAVGVAEAGLFLSSTTGTYWMYGGRAIGTTNYLTDLREIIISGSSASWTLHTVANPKPSARTRMAMANTMAGTGPVCYGGRNNNGVFGDIWLFDEGSKAFSRATPGGLVPQGRRFAMGGIVDGLGYVYGGLCDNGVTDEMWTVSLSGGLPVWVQREPTGTKPPALVDAGIAIDPTAKVMYMFGGSTSATGKGASATGNLYAYHTTSNSWSQIIPGGTAPPARYAAAMCPTFTTGGALNAIWVFGGENGGGKLNDLYRLDLSGGLPGTWSIVVPAGSPPDAREGAVMGWDSRRNRLLLVGGSTNIGANRQYFEFEIGSNVWSSRTVNNASADENFYLSSPVYDDLFRRFFHAPGGKPKSQAIVVTTISPTWQYLIAPATDHALGGVGLFDPATGRYWAVMGERTVSSRPIGTNHVRTFRVK